MQFQIITERYGRWVPWDVVNLTDATAAHRLCEELRTEHGVPFGAEVVTKAKALNRARGMAHRNPFWAGVLTGAPAWAAAAFPLALHFHLL